MTSYRTTMREALEAMNEDNLAKMRKAAGGAKQTLKMKDGSIGMDSFSASAIMQIYDKINDKNKKTFENMMKNGKKADIVKLMKFAMSKVNASYEEFGEEFALDEAKYELYHKDFSSAMQHAYKMAKKLHGITISPDEISDKVATGPRKPSEGKTNKYRLEGDKGGIQIQVYNKGGSKPFELNMYKEEVELDEAKQKPYVSSDRDGKHVMSASGEIAKSFKDMDSANAYLKKNYNKLMKEKLDKEDEPTVKTVVKMLTKASNAHAGQAKDLEKAVKEDSELDEASKFSNADFILGFAVPWAKNPTTQYEPHLVNYVKKLAPSGNREYAYKMVAQVVQQLINGGMPAIRQWLQQNKGYYDKMDSKVKKELMKGMKEEVELDEAEDFKPHKMYDPETGEAHDAKTMEDHLRMKKMGYSYDKPKSKDEGAIGGLIGGAIGAATGGPMGAYKGMKIGSKVGDAASTAAKVAGAAYTAKKGYDAAKKKKEPNNEGTINEILPALAGMAVRAAAPYVAGYVAKKGYNAIKGKDKKKPKVDSAPNAPATESAASDARRAMAADPSTKQKFSKNVSATDDDVKAADKNIMMQMRKAVSLRGNKVEFMDKKKVEIPQKVAQAVLDKYNSQKKPADKEKFQAKVSKSYKSMLTALKEQNEINNKNKSLHELKSLVREMKGNNNG